MSSPSAPNAPSPSQTYKEGLQIYEQFLPQQLQQEQEYRALYDPQRIQEAQTLQGMFGTNQYEQQRQALQQLDPAAYQVRQQLGSTISTALDQGSVDPRQAAIYNQLGNVTARNLARGGIDPTQTAAYRALGQRVTGDLGLGTQLDPQFQRELQQYQRAGQSARGNILGNAPSRYFMNFGMSWECTR